MNAVTANQVQMNIERSPGLWSLAWKRLLGDKVAVVSMVVVIFFLLL